jgi:hypothetical protein
MFIMNLTKNWFACISLAFASLLAVCGDAWTQEWHAVWQPPASNDNAVKQVDWEQRVLKRPQQQQRPAATVATELPTIQQQTAQNSSFDRTPMSTMSMPREPGMPIRPKTRLVSSEQPEEIPPGTPIEPVIEGSVFSEGGTRVHGGCSSCGQIGGNLEGDCDGCGSCGETACGDQCDLGWEVFDGSCGPFLRGLSVFAGVDGFKGPLDRGRNGNFGVNEGLNLARPLGDPWGCGYQIGANFVQSDFSGASVVTTDNYKIYAPMRKQYFATAGIFQRAQGRGVQWGVAYDFMHDIYFNNANLQQIRTQTGYVLDDVYEIGYYGAYGVATDTDRVVDGKLDPTDMFVFYIHRNFENGGDGRIWAGATGNGDGLLGADLWVPLGNGFALENRINYMIPKQGQGENALTRESWGLIVQLVWYPGQNAKCQQQNPYRPLFNVADNSLFMVDRLAH